MILYITWEINFDHWKSWKSAVSLAGVWRVRAAFKDAARTSAPHWCCWRKSASCSLPRCVLAWAREGANLCPRRRCCVSSPLWRLAILPLHGKMEDNLKIYTFLSRLLRARASGKLRLSEKKEDDGYLLRKMISTNLQCKQHVNNIL